MKFPYISVFFGFYSVTDVLDEYCTKHFGDDKNHWTFGTNVIAFIDRKTKVVELCINRQYTPKIVHFYKSPLRLKMFFESLK